MKTLRTALCAGVAFAAFASTPASALNIILQADSSFQTQPGGAQALYAFQKAANFWNQTLTNNTTLVFDVSYAPLPTNVIGSTGSNQVDASFRNVYQGLANNAATPLDQIAVANLHPLTAQGGLGYRMPDSETGVAGTGTGLGLETATRGSVYDNDNSYNNRYAYANTANLKVLGVGYNAADTAFGNNTDASITFSSAFNFDFNPTDGVSNNTEDFIGVAVHEMGHALGFVSGTDTYDYFAHPNGPGAAIGDLYDWDTQSVASIWDLFRYSTNPASNAGFDPATGKRYLQLDPNRGAGFSLDGVNFFNGDSGNFANFSTGAYNGDLSQASHWKDANGYSDANGCFHSNTQIGIMDPTSGFCQLGVVTANDLAAFDAMGYNLNFDVLQNLGYTFNSAQIYNLPGLAIAAVPEPATWAMMLAGFGLVGFAARRRVRMTVTYA